MKKRRLGNSEASALGFGCIGLSGYGPAIEKQQAIEIASLKGMPGDSNYRLPVIAQSG